MGVINNMATFSVKNLNESLALNKAKLDNNFKTAPLMLLGQHGIGKTAILEGWASANNLEVIFVIASQYGEGDFIGLPKKSEDGDYITFLKPEFFKKAIDKPCLLFFDELDRATIEVRQAIFQMASSRKLGNEKFHQNTMIVSAINGNLSDDYQTNPLDLAEASRWDIVIFKPLTSEWLDWGTKTKSLQEVIVAYLKKHNDLIESDFSNDNEVTLFDDNENMIMLPDRRKWEYISNDIKMLEKLDIINKERIIASVSKTVGTDIAVSFATFYENFQNLEITVENFLKLKDSQVKAFTSKFNDLDNAIQDDFIDTLLKAKELKLKKHLKKVSVFSSLIANEKALILLLYYNVKDAIEKKYIASEKVFEIFGITDENTKNFTNFDREFILNSLCETDTSILFETYKKVASENIVFNGNFPLTLIELILNILAKNDHDTKIVCYEDANNDTQMQDIVSILENYWNIPREKIESILALFFEKQAK